jgi:hypothetical protein
MRYEGRIAGSFSGGPPPLWKASSRVVEARSSACRPRADGLPRPGCWRSPAPGARRRGRARGRRRDGAERVRPSMAGASRTRPRGTEGGGVAFHDPLCGLGGETPPNRRWAYPLGTPFADGVVKRHPIGGWVAKTTTHPLMGLRFAHLSRMGSRFTTPPAVPPDGPGRLGEAVGGRVTARPIRASGRSPARDRRRGRRLPRPVPPPPEAARPPRGRGGARRCGRAAAPPPFMCRSFRWWCGGVVVVAAPPPSRRSAPSGGVGGSSCISAAWRRPPGSTGMCP